MLWQMLQTCKELWNLAISYSLEEKCLYVQVKATWNKIVGGKKKQPNVLAKWAFIKDMSKHLIVGLIAVHSQKNLCACWAPSGTPVSRRNSSLLKLRPLSQKGDASKCFPGLLLELASFKVSKGILANLWPVALTHSTEQQKNQTRNRIPSKEMGERGLY